MKPLLTFFSAAFLLFGAVGCADLGGGGGGYTAEELSRPMPRVGMTKAEVLRGYGTPAKRTFTSRGEIWIYWLKRPSAVSLLVGDSESKTAGFVFDPTGTVIDFHFNE